MLTAQEIFTKVKNHLLAQGKKSIGEKGCMYRGDYGTMCAAGCLIADEYYNKSFEGRLVNFGLIKEALRKSGISAVYDDLIFDLQITHDNYYPEHWPEQLKRVAEKHGLKYEEAQS